jgi:branched-chain amino acid transport system ATP-binding protein
MLSVSVLETYYGRIQALKGVTLNVDSGKVVCILGANGAGKTTLVNNISGIVECQKGAIEFNGQRIENIPPERIVKLGISQVPQGRLIFPDLTVIENLRIGAFTRKDEEVKTDLDRLHSYFPILKERRSQYGKTLSGGEQQMLAIARALMSRPKLLLMDEPSLGLSPIFTKTIFGIISRLNGEGMTILLVEQNAKLAMKVSHFGYVLETGKIVLEGNSKTLMSDEAVKRSYLGG